MALALLTGSLAGCTSANGTSSITLEETQQLFDAAKFTGAATKSPYEFYSAEIYLKKAMDEMNLGNTKKADVYMNKAYEQAQAAYENAKRYERSK
jgi:hypothetical protein